MKNPAEATRADREKALIAYRVHHLHIKPYELRPADEEWLNTGCGQGSWYEMLQPILAAVVAARLEERDTIGLAVSKAKQPFINKEGPYYAGVRTGFDIAMKRILLES